MNLRRSIPGTIKSVAFLAVILAISSATLKSRRTTKYIVETELRYDVFDTKYSNNTCALDIMERYNCTEIACEDQAGIINYLYVQECLVHGWQRPIMFICWFLLLSFVIYILATTADKYFCVSLTDMVEKMGIPPSIAGVTFLSFGNGGPDVFALMTAIIGGHSHIGLGSNLGAGLFITTVITGVVAFMADCKVNPLSFYRDVITYIVSTIYMAYVFFDNKIKLWEIIGFIVIYILYVTIVIFFRKQSSDVYDDVEQMSRTGSKEVLLTQDDVDEIVGTTGLSVTAKVKIMSEPMYSIRHVVKEMVLEEFDDDDDASHPVLPDKYKSNKSMRHITQSLSSDAKQALTERIDLLTAIDSDAQQTNPSRITVLIDHLKKETQYFKDMKWFWKPLYLIEAPFTFLRNVTIPVVMEERYNKYTLLLTSFGMPLFLFYKSDKSLSDTMLSVPYWAILLTLIPFLFFSFFFLTPWNHTPSGWMFFVILFISFFMSIMWVEEIAHELVSLMSSLGSLAHIQPFVMGLTVLAVGNSISDLIGDMTITRQGYPQMAIGGIYASPMFSMLIGLGVALLVKYLENPNELTLGEDTVVINLTIIFLLLTLIITLIVLILLSPSLSHPQVVPLQKYTFTKKFGIFLISFYLVSMLINVLAATKILVIPFLEPRM